jgi:hypothetical protein
VLRHQDALALLDQRPGVQPGRAQRRSSSLNRVQVH